MAWKTIVRDANADGVLVYSIDQGNLIRLSTDEDAEATEEGVCMALCIRWLGLRARSLDLDRFFRSSQGFDHVIELPPGIFGEQADRAIDVMMHSDRVLVHATRSGANPTGLSYQQASTERTLGLMGVTRINLLARQGLRARREVTCPAGLDPALLAGFVNGRDALALVSLRRPGGAHAVTMQCETAANRFRLFDPNFGHFAVTGRVAFELFLTRFITDSGYGRYTRVILYDIESIGGPPPPPVVAPDRSWLIDDTYAGLPTSRPAAVVPATRDFRFLIAFRKAMTPLRPIGERSRLRVFVVGPRADDDFHAATRTVLSECERLVRTGWNLRVTPFVRADTRLEVRIHFT